MRFRQPGESINIVGEYYEFRSRMTRGRWPSLLWNTRYALPTKARKKFLTTLTLLLARVGGADGRLSSAERSVIEELLEDELQLSSNEHAFCLKMVRDAEMQRRAGIGDLALDYYIMFKRSPRMLTNMIHSLFAVAYADNTLQPLEEAAIRQVATAFRFDTGKVTKMKQEYLAATEERRRWERKLEDLLQSRTARNAERIFARGRQSARSSRTTGTTNEWTTREWTTRPEPPPPSPLEEAHKTLGCAPHDSLEIIKRRYRLLVLELHPDRVKLRGESQARQQELLVRFHKVQEAYELICNARGG